MAEIKVAIFEKDNEQYGLGPREYDALKMFKEVGHTTVGWSHLKIDEQIIIPEGRIAVVSKFDSQDGYVEHDGYILGEG